MSAHAFNDPELLPILKRELTYHNVDPRRLMFEITETAALENLPGARVLMIEIKELDFFDIAKYLALKKC